MISQAKKYGHRFQISMPFGESLKMKVRWVCQGHTYSLHNLSLFYQNAFWQTTLSDRFIYFFKLTCPHCYFMRLNLKKGVSLILPSSSDHRVFICRTFVFVALLYFSPASLQMRGYQVLSNNVLCILMSVTSWSFLLDGS